MRGNWFAVSLESGQLSDVEDLRFVHSSAITDDVLDKLDEGGRAAAAVGERVGVGFGALLDQAAPVPSVSYVVSVRVTRDEFGNSFHVGHVVAVHTGLICEIPTGYGHGRRDYLKSAAAALGVIDYGDLVNEGARVVVLVSAHVVGEGSAAGRLGVGVAL